MSITILYVFKNKEVSRVKKSLDSLLIQNQAVDVLFVDYGSDTVYADEIQDLLKQYDFVRYLYTYHKKQPWSRAKAINIGLQSISSEYVFVADIDIIFAPQFLETIQSLAKPERSYYFKVGFLSEKESQKQIEFAQYQPDFFSKPGAMGMSLFSIKDLKALNGFNEFYHFWGAEDEDIHYRLKLHGITSNFYNDEVLLLHQWHPIYRVLAQNKLTVDLQVYNIARFNQEHFKYIKSNGDKIVDTEGFGILLTQLDYERLKTPDTSTSIESQKYAIDYFLAYTIHHLQIGEVYHFSFHKGNCDRSLKKRMKHFIKPNQDGYYTMKFINDMILKSLVAIRDIQYSFEVLSNEYLTLSIRKL
jgi:glycosyltransferase involved in cell wall biosynthesis